jgi:predicted NUDIX family phosphoesterase
VHFEFRLLISENCERRWNIRDVWTFFEKMRRGRGEEQERVLCIWQNLFLQVPLWLRFYLSRFEM